MRKFTSKSTAKTLRIARKLSRVLKKGDVVGFYGKLGAGKTTFIKGIAEGLGVAKERVTSSSFVILRSYKARFPIYHVDLYRLNSRQVPDEVYEYMDDASGLTLIEWAERIELPREHFRVDITLKDLERRAIRVSAKSKSLNPRLKRF